MGEEGHYRSVVQCAAEREQGFSNTHGVLFEAWYLAVTREDNDFEIFWRNEAVVAALSVSWIHFREPVPEQRSIRFTIPTEAGLPSQVRISPDGTRLARICRPERPGENSALGPAAR